MSESSDAEQHRHTEAEARESRDLTHTLTGGVMTQLLEQMTSLNMGLQGIMQGQADLKSSWQVASSSHKQYASASQAAPAVDSGQSPPLEHSAQPAKSYLIPNGVRIMDRTAKLAISGEYINLTEFIPISECSMNSDLEPIVENNGNLVFRTKKLKRSIDNFNQWLAAWDNYEFLMVSDQHKRYPHMAKYRSFIQKCANKFQWFAVYAYDCRFRSQLAHEPEATSFGSVDTDLYASVFDVTSVRRDGKSCHRCRSREHLVGECPFPATEATSETSQKAFSSTKSRYKREICNNFNAGRCMFASCSRVHACQSCGGSEPQIRCPCHNRGSAIIGQQGLGNMSRPPPRP